MLEGIHTGSAPTPFVFNTYPDVPAASLSQLATPLKRISPRAIPAGSGICFANVLSNSVLRSAANKISPGIQV